MIGQPIIATRFGMLLTLAVASAIGASVVLQGDDTAPAPEIKLTSPADPDWGQVISLAGEDAAVRASTIYLGREPVEVALGSAALRIVGLDGAYKVVPSAPGIAECWFDSRTPGYGWCRTRVRLEDLTFHPTDEDDCPAHAKDPDQCDAVAGVKMEFAVIW